MLWETCGMHDGPKITRFFVSNTTFLSCSLQAYRNRSPEHIMLASIPFVRMNTALAEPDGLAYGRDKWAV